MTWALRVTEGGRIATAVALSPRWAVTCEHVVRGFNAVDVDDEFGARVRCRVLDPDPELDLALLEPESSKDSFADESQVLPRALWRGARLIDDEAEVQLATDEPDTPRSLRVTLRHAPQRARRVEFVVPDAREGVHPGYSGGPVVEVGWNVEPRLVGIVRSRDPSTIDALDQAGKGALVPTERIAERYPTVAALVETPIERSDAWDLHWEPRSRGVARARDRGFLFAGRREAYLALREHLGDGAGLLVVSGRRGSGKSALLAHLVVLSCPRYGTLVGETALGDLPPLPQPVDAAVWARAKTAAEVAHQLGEQLGLGDVEGVGLVAALERQPSGVVIVVDAIDEAVDPAAVMRDVIVPAAQAGAAVAIGGLKSLVVADAPSDTTWTDLDQDDSGAAITSYVTQRLTLHGGYQPRESREIAAAVAERADGLFVVAELIARNLADSTREPIDTQTEGWEQQLPSDLTEAFRDYLGRFGRDQARVLAVLHPLAHARGSGLTIRSQGAWLVAANALRPDVDPLDESALRQVAERASAYLVTTPAGERRLYHDALGDAVLALAARSQAALVSGTTPDEQIDLARARFTDALIGLLPADWNAPAAVYEDLDPYLARHLPSHLPGSDKMAELFRPGLLLVAEREALSLAFVRGALSVPPELEPARVAAVHALAREQPTQRHRAASLRAAFRRQGQADLAVHIADAADDRSRPTHAGLPFELISAPPLPPVLATIPDAHAGAITALAVTADAAGPLIVSGGSDGALKSWRLDGSAGPLQQRDAHDGGIEALAVASGAPGPLIVSGGRDGALKSWRLDGTAGPLQVRDADPDRLEALAVTADAAGPLIVSGGRDGALRSWRLDGSAGPLQQTGAHDGSINALAVTADAAGPLIVSGGRDAALRSWRLDGSAGLLQVRDADPDWIAALAVSANEDGPLIVSGGADGLIDADGALRTWRLDGSAGPLHQGGAHASALVLAVDGEGPLIVSGGHGGALESRRLDGGAGPLQLRDAHRVGITALAVTPDAAGPLIVSGGWDGALKSWRLDGSAERPRDRDTHHGAIMALSVTTDATGTVILSGGRDGALGSWRLDGSAGPLQDRYAHRDAIRALAVTADAAGTVILSGGSNGALRSWRLDGSAGPLRAGGVSDREMTALAVTGDADGSLIVSGGADLGGALMSWRLDGSTGPLSVRHANLACIMALAVTADADGPLIVSGGRGGALKSWRFDGSAGPLQQSDAHNGGIQALAVAADETGPLIVSGGRDGELKSWRLDGTAGALQAREAHASWVMALAVTADAEGPLIISGGGDGVLRSWRLNGDAGPLQERGAHAGAIMALAVTAGAEGPLIVSGGEDGAIISHPVSIEI